MERRGKIIECTSGDVITLKDLEATLAAQKTRIRPGDILLLRVGWLKSYLASSQRSQGPGIATRRCPRHGSDPGGRPMAMGPSIAAVASDSPAFEAVNSQAMGEMLHPYLLAFFGMPIGEMWDLEALADDCAADKRYTSSSPPRR